MDPVRSAAISAPLRAYEAWALVEVHHPRGLESFAVDAYVECGRVNTILNELGVRLWHLATIGLPRRWI